MGARYCAPVQTGPGAHPASCTMGTRSFPGVKSGRGVKLTPHPLLVPWLRKSRAIPLLPLWAARHVQSLSACTRVHLLYPYFITQRDIRLLYRFPCVRSFYLTSAVFPITLFPRDFNVGVGRLIATVYVCCFRNQDSCMCLFFFAYWIWNCLLVVTRLPVVRVTYWTQYSRYNTVAVTKTVHNAQEWPPLTL